MSDDNVLKASGGFCAPVGFDWEPPVRTHTGITSVDLIGLDMIAAYGADFCERLLGLTIADGHVQISAKRPLIRFIKPPPYEAS